MKKIIHIFGFVICLFCSTLILSGCKDNTEVIDGMYEKDGFYFPIETKGCKIESITLYLFLNVNSYTIEGQEDINELLTLVSAKRPEYIGRMNHEEFRNFYFSPGRFKFLSVIFYFTAKRLKEPLIYTMLISREGAIYVCSEFSGKAFHDDLEKEDNTYKYTENNYVDFSALIEFYEKIVANNR